jgi:hypothetical protein
MVQETAGYKEKGRSFQDGFEGWIREKIPRRSLEMCIVNSKNGTIC